VTTTIQAIDQELLEALAKRGFAPLHARTGAEARDLVLGLLPEGALVAHGSSATLQQIGVIDALQGSSRVRYGNAEWLSVPDPAERAATRGRISVGADVFLGGVQAVTRTGQVVGADQGGSRQAFYTFGPRKVIWVVGANKLVNSLDEAISRVYEVALPLEDARAKSIGWGGSAVNKLVIYEADPVPGRVTIVLVDESLGF